MGLLANLGINPNSALGQSLAAKEAPTLAQPITTNMNAQAAAPAPAPVQSAPVAQYNPAAAAATAATSTAANAALSAPSHQYSNEDVASAYQNLVAQGASAQDIASAQKEYGISDAQMQQALGQGYLGQGYNAPVYDWNGGGGNFAAEYGNAAYGTGANAGIYTAGTNSGEMLNYGDRVASNTALADIWNTGVNRDNTNYWTAADPNYQGLLTQTGRAPIFYDPGENPNNQAGAGLNFQHSPGAMGSYAYTNYDSAGAVNKPSKDARFHTGLYDWYGGKADPSKAWPVGGTPSAPVPIAHGGAATEVTKPDGVTTTTPTVPGTAQPPGSSVPAPPPPGGEKLASGNDPLGSTINFSPGETVSRNTQWVVDQETGGLKAVPLDTVRQSANVTLGMAQAGSNPALSKKSTYTQDSELAAAQAIPEDAAAVEQLSDEEADMLINAIMGTAYDMSLSPEQNLAKLSPEARADLLKKMRAYILNSGGV